MHPRHTHRNRISPDAGLVTLAILNQIPPQNLQRYTQLAAQRTDDNDLANELLDLCQDPSCTERRIAESVSMFMTYTDLQPDPQHV